LYNYTYEYDKAGNQTQKVETKAGSQGLATSYQYDRLNHLLKVTEPGSLVTEYTYDPAGNRLTEAKTSEGKTKLVTYTYNEQNRLISTKEDIGTTKESVEYIYDNNGNLLYSKKEQLTLITDPKNIPEASFSMFIPGQTTKEENPFVSWISSYQYDEFNQMTKSTTADGVIENKYNGEGLRAEKTLDGELTRYLYIEDQPVLEVDQNGQETARNIVGTNMVSRIVDKTSEMYYLYNGHGDVTELITPQGDIAAEYTYDAFGVPKTTTGKADNPFRYAGYQYDESGLYYLKSRMYNPVIARFMQEDTYRGELNDPLSLNLYAYCNNNPLIYDDPDGHGILKKIKSAVKAVTKIVAKAVTKTTAAIKAGTDKITTAVKAATMVVKTNGTKAEAVIKTNTAASAVVTKPTNAVSKVSSAVSVAVKNTASSGTSSSSARGSTASSSSSSSGGKLSSGPSSKGSSSGSSSSRNSTITNFAAGVAASVDNNMFFGAAQGITKNKMQSDSTAFKAGKVIGDMGSIIAGGQAIAGGTAAEVGGLGLDATGVGAFAGVPLNVAGAAAIAYGSATFSRGTSSLFNDSLDLMSGNGGGNAPQEGVGGKGWRGDKTWKSNVNEISAGGTIENINGSIPRQQEAIDLINSSGGKVVRVEGAHPEGGISNHTYPHINYITSSGTKGTIRIEEVINK
jgi:RHS repeat-associated protein